ncbi:MAG: glycosyltransferase family protein [Terriglobales bacterium]
MKITAIIQARMGSTRLPGKVLKDLQGETALARVLARLRRAATIGEVIVATSNTPGDDVIVAECKRLKTNAFRGEENDVLDRYYQAAQFSKAEVVVRITADCPLIDPEVVDETVTTFLHERPDYASNTLVRTYPRGLDTEVFSMQALEIAWREAAQPYQRAHVTPYIYQNPERFKVLAVKGEQNYGDLRWTLDTEPDLEFLRAVYSRLGGRDTLGWRDVLRLLEREPSLSEINRHVAQKALHEG